MEPANANPHPPLSQSLAALLRDETGGLAITLNLLLDRTAGRGLYLVIIVLSLPFVGPVSVPGMSPPFGLAIALLALGLARGQAPNLPRRIGDRALPAGLKKVLLSGGVKFLRGLERLVKPRGSAWMSWRVIHAGNALLVAFMAILLALPLPPVPPFTNALPSYAIILLAAAMLEEDGVMIWLGYAAALGTTLYFAFWAEFIAKHLFHWGHRLAHFLHLGS